MSPGTNNPIADARTIERSVSDAVVYRGDVIRQLAYSRSLACSSDRVTVTRIRDTCV